MGGMEWGNGGSLRRCNRQSHWPKSARSPARDDHAGPCACDHCGAVLLPPTAGRAESRAAEFSRRVSALPNCLLRQRRAAVPSSRTRTAGEAGSGSGGCDMTGLRQRRGAHRLCAKLPFGRGEVRRCGRLGDPYDLTFCECARNYRPLPALPRGSRRARRIPGIRRNPLLGH